MKVKLRILQEDGSYVLAEAETGSWRSVIQLNGKLYERDFAFRGTVHFKPANVLELGNIAEKCDRDTAFREG